MDDALIQKLDAFFSQFKHQQYKQGEVLIRADENPSGIFYLKEGTVKQYAISQKGEELVVNIYKPVSFFPMSWALNATPNAYYFEAITTIDVWKAPREELVTFIRNEQDLLFNLMKRVYNGTDGILTRMVYLMSGSAKKRLIAEMLIQAKRFGHKNSQTGTITLHITEKDLAARAGMTRETVSRELKLLKEQHLLTVGTGRVIIADINKLEEELAT